MGELIGGVGWESWLGELVFPSSFPATLAVVKMPRKTTHRFMQSDDQNHQKMRIRCTMSVQYIEYLSRPSPLSIIGGGSIGGSPKYGPCLYYRALYDSCIPVLSCNRLALPTLFVSLFASLGTTCLKSQKEMFQRYTSNEQYIYCTNATI